MIFLNARAKIVIRIHITDSILYIQTIHKIVRKNTKELNQIHNEARNRYTGCFCSEFLKSTLIILYQNPIEINTIINGNNP